MAAFINTYNAAKNGCLATNMSTKKHVKRNTTFIYLLQPDYSQFVINSTTFIGQIARNYNWII